MMSVKMERVLDNLSSHYMPFTLLSKERLSEVVNVVRFVELRKGEILQNATTFRFDASDLMPGAIGAGTFWTGMVDFVGGASAADVAGQIQESWDALK